MEVDKFVVHQSHDFDMAGQRILGDGVVTGSGRIHGRPAFVFAQDFTVFGGSLSDMHARKICKIMDLAVKTGAPIIGLNDSGGARIQEGVVSLAGYAEVFLRHTLPSGVVPQISAVMGPCAGGAVYSPALTDFIFMVKNTSYMFVTGPDVIRAVTHETVSAEDLGGARTHGTTSGVAHFAADSEEECLALIRELMTFLPQNNLEDPPLRATRDPVDRRDESFQSIVPDQPNKPYYMLDIVRTVLTRKAYGGAYCVMSSKHIRGDANFAYPTAEIAVMGPEGAVNILYRREMEQAGAPATLREAKTREFREMLATPYVAAERGYIDEVIEPRDTRARLCAALELTRTKRDTNPPKKHGNLPL